MNIRHQKAGWILLPTLACLAVAMLGGCKAKDPVVGKWTDEKKTATIEFKADKTFAQGDGAKALSGKWALADKKVTITLETIGGKSLDETLKGYSEMAAKMNPTGPKPDVAKMRAQMGSFTLTLSDDGKTLSAPAPPSAPKGTPSVTLTRVEEK